jgi:hypothetical protein
MPYFVSPVHVSLVHVCWHIAVVVSGAVLAPWDVAICVLTVIHRNTHWYVPLVSCFCALGGAINGGWVCGEGDCISNVTVGTGGA